MTTDRTTPTGCPDWCRRHQATTAAYIDDNGGDHAAEPTWVPSTVLHRTIGTRDRHLSVEASEMLVVLTQPTDCPEPWIYVGEAEGTSIQVELSVGSAGRLVRAIGEQLAQL